MAKTEISAGCLMLVERHKAAGAETGSNAMSAMKKISNTDPSEGVWNAGDEFEVPAAEDLNKVAFIAKVNGNNAPAIAVHCKGVLGFWQTNCKTRPQIFVQGKKHRGI